MGVNWTLTPFSKHNQKRFSEFLYKLLLFTLNEVFLHKKIKHMRAVIAVNNLGYIGKDNTLLWKCSEDLKHFKNLTTGGSLLVGYNTSLKLPPLKNREIFVYKREYTINDDLFGCDWCIGGKKTYETFCHLFTELHISHINDSKIGDTTFPELKNLNPDCKIFNYYFEPDL